MTRIEKLVDRLLSRPKDFTYAETARLLAVFGYIESYGGKTSGSRVAFIHPEKKRIIRLHKPHPGNVLKAYQITLLIEHLKELNLL